jgi:hypothetical protein
MGKGFAVVANEVKELSKMTKKAAEGITVSISDIKAQSTMLGKSMGQSESQCNSIQKILENFSARLFNADDKNSSAISVLAASNSQTFMTLAKLDHVIFKVNTYLSVIHSKPTFDFVDHHSCRLGKWYSSGCGKETFSHTPSYRQVDFPHSEVHNNTQKIFDILGQANSTEQVANFIHAMEHASDGVFSGLDKMFAEKHVYRK